MGIRANPVPWYSYFISVTLSIIPAFLMKLTIDRPSQVLVFFLYFAVHIQSCILVPVISNSSFGVQLVFLFFLTLAQLCLELRYLISLIRFKQIYIEKIFFWISFFSVITFSFIYLSIKGTSSLSSFSFIEVYGQRLELLEKSNSIGILFFYLSNWLGAVLIPFLLVVALVKKRHISTFLVIVLALVNFSMSSNKTNYMNLLLVLWGFILLQKFSRFLFSNLMAFSLIMIIFFLSFIDMINGLVIGDNYHFFSWIFFHRTFTNNGFLSAIYLDLMQNIDYGFYQDSFLGWMRLSSQEPIAVLAGKSFTEVEGVHANANIWADAYANLGYLGILLSAFFLTILLHIYDSLSKDKSQFVSVLLIFVQASVIANTSVYTAILSNGFLVLFVLIASINKWTIKNNDTFLQKRQQVYM